MPQDIASSTASLDPADIIKSTEASIEHGEESKENTANTDAQSTAADGPMDFGAEDCASVGGANEPKKFDYAKFSKPDSLVVDNEDTIDEENKIETPSDVQSNTQPTEANSPCPAPLIASLKTVEVNSIRYANPESARRTQVENLSMLESSFNCPNSSVDQSLFGSEFRRRARRRTGRMIAKRKLEIAGDGESCVKRRRTDAIESFLVIYRDLLKNRKFSDKYEKEIEELKIRLRAAEASGNLKIEQERRHLDRMKSENLEVSQKIEQELKDLRALKETVFKEFERIREDKKALQDEREKLHLEKMQSERRILEEEYRRETIRLEAERTMISEERKKLEDMRRLEMLKAREEVKKLQMEKAEEVRKLMEEKALLERQLIDQSIHLENERKLLREERGKASQTLCEPTARPFSGTFRQKDVGIRLPEGKKMEIQKKDTIMHSGRDEIKSRFRMAMKSYDDKLSQSQLADLSKQVAVTKQPSKEPQHQAFTKQTLQKQHIKIDQPKIENEKIDAHFLYKRSIDAQLSTPDPKKYVPKTAFPFYANEDEFENEDKKFVPALFTKDPKLNYTVKNQDHDEIRSFFGDKKDIDVEHIFSQIENVSNYSPNKLRGR